MISQDRYDEISKQIIDIISGADSPIKASDLVKELRQCDIPREIGSTIMLEMVGAGYLSRRPEDRRLSLTENNRVETGVPVS